MPSARIGIDGGAVIVVNGVAYWRVSTTPSPGAVTGVASKTNVPGRTWSYDDSGVLGGPDHRVWTACECAIAGWGTGNQGSCYCPDGGSYYLFTAPSNGVARSAHYPQSYDYGTSFYVNSIFRVNWSDTTGWAGPSSWPTAGGGPFKLLTGDVVTIRSASNNYQYLWFLPDVY